MVGVRDAVVLGRHAVIWAFVWLVAKLIVAFIALACMLALQGLPTDFMLGSSPMPASVLRLVQLQATASMVSLFAFLVSALISGRWIYRMANVTQAIGHDVSVTPGWAVGWFFIPFASLVKPFESIKEAWQVTADPIEWSLVPVPVMLRAWWALWLGLNFVGYIGSLGPRFDTGVGGLKMLSSALILSGAVAVALTIVWARIVQSISRSQALMLSAAAFR